MEIGAVDGVAVEHIRAVPGDRPDPDMAMFELGALVAEADPADAVTVLGHGLATALEADWVVVTNHDGDVEFTLGDPPELGWLTAFLEGSEHLRDREHSGPADVMWARLPRAGRSITLGRAARAAHERERVRLRLLARTVDHLLASPVGYRGAPS